MKNKPTNRRNFLKDGLRLLAAAVLAWFGIRLASRPADPHACINNGLCRGCTAYRGCILPQARSLRENPGYRPGGQQAHGALQGVDKSTSLQDGRPE